MAKDKFITTRVWTETQHILRVLAALRNSSIIDLMDELARKEAASLGIEIVMPEDDGDTQVLAPAGLPPIKINGNEVVKGSLRRDSKR